MSFSAVITLRLDPFIHLGPLTIAWHGLTIAIGLGLGSLLAKRWLSERGLVSDPLFPLALLLAVGGIVGGRLFYLVEHGGPLLGTIGFTFDGGVILAVLLLFLFVWRTKVCGRYLDAIAAGLPFGVAVGRIGDVINGEHYGPRSDFFLAVRNANPHALTPDSALAYQNGGLYEVLLGTLVFGIVWPLRHHFRRPLDLSWLVLALFAAGRFAEFFARSDSPKLALGLDNAQWTSVGLLVVVAVGWLVTRRHYALRMDGSEPSARDRALTEKPSAQDLRRAPPSPD